MHFIVFLELKISFPLIKWSSRLVNEFLSLWNIRINSQCNVKLHTWTCRWNLYCCIFSQHHIDVIERIWQTWEEWGVTWLARVCANRWSRQQKLGENGGATGSNWLRAEEVLCLTSTAFPSRLTCSFSFASSLFIVAHQPPLLVAVPWYYIARKEETSMPDWQCRARLNALDRLLYFVDLSWKL